MDCPGEELFKKLAGFGQQELIDHCRLLTPRERAGLLDELGGLDFALAFDLHREFLAGKAAAGPREIGTAPVIPLPASPREESERAEARLRGESMIRDGRVAVLIVAGGQGTRLGFPGPKGKFPISPVKNKSLFQLFAEAIRAISRRYGAEVPLLLMTSRENRRETEDFFTANGFFGLKRGSVFFFDQEVLPTLSPEGRLLLQEGGRLLVNPDGHGGSLKAIFRSGLLQKLMSAGVEELFYCQVDNPLVRILDPVFIGYHRGRGAEISTKVVRRQDPEEKVGIYGMLDGRPAIVEYSDFRPEDYRALDEKGNPRYWAGNTAIHLISLPLIERLNRDGFALPYHRAVKETECLLPKAGRPERAACWKFETFVFDAIPLARNSCCLEVAREEEFSPVKNDRGIDSPETARAAMAALHRRWLEEAGAVVRPGAVVEISPLFALDKEELAAKLRGRNLAVEGEFYLGSSE